MRTITTSSGTKISLDGDLLAVLEALYRELTRQHGLDRTFEGTMKEINVLIAQFSDTEREQYLRESLFLNTVTYENEQASRTSTGSQESNLSRVTRSFGSSVLVLVAVDDPRASLQRPRRLRLCDPCAQRVLGDARRQKLSDIWLDTTAHTLRRELNAGGSRFCGDCPLKLPLPDDAQPPQRSLDVAALPNRLYVECTAACNLSCLDACCAPETGITRTREAGMLDFDLFTRVIDEAGEALVRVDFFNYGEAFLHKRAIEMCDYIKRRFPHIYLYTSTNGLAFDAERARALVHSGIDEVTFSLDGALPESYVKYHRRGDLDVVLRNLEANGR